MDLQQIKNDLNNAGIRPESLRAINVVLDKALAQGYLAEEEGNRISHMIDVELEFENIKTDTRKEISAAVKDYLKGTNDVINKTISEIEAAVKKFDADLQAIKSN